MARHSTFKIAMLMMGCMFFNGLMAQTISTFDTDNEGWKVTGDATDADPDWVANGGNPGGYVTTTDAVTGGIWYWSAPVKFRGNHAGAYGNALQFDIKQSSLNNQFNSSDVIIAGTSLTIYLDLPNNPLTSWTHYNVPLDISMDWRKGSATGDVATEADIRLVLSNIVSLRIRGEFVTGADVGDLDNVILPGAVLPIQLISFKAKDINQKVYLEWTTLNEVEGDRYEIQHSTDGITFRNVTVVKAVSNFDQAAKQYSFLHAVLPADQNFYRLKMVDKDGSYQYSSIVRISVNGKFSIRLYPNPTRGRLLIGGLPEACNCVLKVVNTNGNLVLLKNIRGNQATADLSGFAAGNYHVALYENNNLLTWQKIIKLP